MSLVLLENPAWHSLQTLHAPFAMGEGGFSRYRGDVLPVAALQNMSTWQEDFEQWFEPGDMVHFVGPRPPLPKRFEDLHNSPCWQMVYDSSQKLPINKEVVGLGVSDYEAMYNLVHQVMPGYYARNTPKLGNFFGIKEAGKLVAMAGVRLCVPGFSELTAVVTHPDFRGLGYASAVSAAVVNHLLAQGITPFLHTGMGNQTAISIYEKLHFKRQRAITWWRVRYLGVA